MSAQDSLAKALMAIYALASLPVLYIAVRHGLRGALGWGYLFVFCSIKLIGNGMELHDPTSSGAAVVSNVGLSPLLLAVAGVLHEARHYRCRFAGSSSNAKRDAMFVLLFHMLAMAGVALMAVGASKLISAASNPIGPTTAADTSKAHGLASAGIALLFISWLALVSATVISVLVSSGIVESAEKAVSEGMTLMLAVATALPFLGIRVIAGFVYYVGNKQELSPVGGSMGPVVGLEVVEEIIVTLVLVAAGLVTRNIVRDQSRASKVSSV